MQHKTNNSTGIPEILPWGHLSETFLVCGEDGIVRVKDGRALGEYINDPRLVERRVNSQLTKPFGMVLTNEEWFNHSLGRAS